MYYTYIQRQIVPTCGVFKHEMAHVLLSYHWIVELPTPRFWVHNISSILYVIFMLNIKLEIRRQNIVTRCIPRS